MKIVIDLTRCQGHVRCALATPDVCAMRGMRRCCTTQIRILDYSHRADPYPLYAELRNTPVVQAEDGRHVVSSYREIVTDPPSTTGSGAC